MITMDQMMDVKGFASNDKPAVIYHPTLRSFIASFSSLFSGPQIYCFEAGCCFQQHKPNSKSMLILLHICYMYK